MERGGPEGLPPFKLSSLDVEPGWAALEALVGRLQAVAPEGITVAAGPNSVDLVYGGAVRWASQSLKLNAEDDVQDLASLEHACIGVLDAFQDWAAEETADPWPAPQGEMPMPGVEVEDQLIRLWYGDQRSPALTLEPIRREDLR